MKPWTERRRDYLTDKSNERLRVPYVDFRQDRSLPVKLYDTRTYDRGLMALSRL